MKKLFCSKCNYMEERPQMDDIMLVSPLCPHCNSLMYYKSKLTIADADWENYPTTSC